MPAHEPDRREVQPRRQPVPAEDPQPEERRLEEERGEALDGQGRAEHAADEVEYTDQFIPNWNSCTRPVATPIAKLINSSVPKNRVSRSHAVVARAVPDRLHDRHERREPERERDEQEVVDRRRRELEPGEVHGVDRANTVRGR